MPSQAISHLSLLHTHKYCGLAQHNLPSDLTLTYADPKLSWQVCSQSPISHMPMWGVALLDMFCPQSQPCASGYCILALMAFCQMQSHECQVSSVVQPGSAHQSPKFYTQTRRCCSHTDGSLKFSYIIYPKIQFSFIMVHTVAQADVPNPAVTLLGRYRGLVHHAPPKPQLLQLLVGGGTASQPIPVSHVGGYLDLPQT